MKENFFSSFSFFTDRVESEHQAAGWLQRRETPTRSLRPSGESPAGDGENWGHLKQITKSICLPVQLWKAQKIKQVSGWPWYFCRGSNYTCSLWPPDIVGMMSRSVHTGNHSPRHRREDLHAIPNVRYELRWWSLQMKIPLFFQLDFLFPAPPISRSLLSAFNHHLLARAGYVLFGTPIVSFIWSSCFVFATHFTGL